MAKCCIGPPLAGPARLGIILLLLSCKKEEETVIEYPATGFYGDNLLLKAKTVYTEQENSLGARIPQGKKVKIIITSKAALIPSGVWFYEPATNNNWAITDFNSSSVTQAFSLVNGGLTCELRMNFDKGTFQIDYNENDSLSPTLTKTIKVD